MPKKQQVFNWINAEPIFPCIWYHYYDNTGMKILSLNYDDKNGFFGVM